MAGVCCSPRVRIPLLPHPTRIHKIQCCAKAPDNKPKRETPPILKVAVTGATELLRVLSSFNPTTRLEKADDKQRDEFSVIGIDDVVSILEADYKNAYFVTGIFTSAIYAEDCVFEDPTIRFQGTELYARNLKLLVPFFDSPSIGLEKIEKGIDSEATFVLATWKLRTYLKLPWRPLISIDGSTVYNLDDKFKIVRHAESWNVSAIEAVGQIFRPSGRSDD
ncbi:PREDICTED: uncharacterized protein LOC101306256 [Fragaria vesca subsp. vesca]|uniref:uncharacterized protein LOC101306256 n=1 Tax=Fragaria vesca subsp. vesca TaxID=101020 RepID=UPI0002C33021|nr:PREDICTED: uncharacterized protein LOC101306256 [Fragaria vesca subsp. vesca]